MRPFQTLLSKWCTFEGALLVSNILKCALYVFTYF